MAEAAGLVLVDREVLIEEEQLAQGTDLRLTIELCVLHLDEGFVLDAVDLGFDTEDLLIDREKTGQYDGRGGFAHEVFLPCSVRPVQLALGTHTSSVRCMTQPNAASIPIFSKKFDPAMGRDPTRAKMGLPIRRIQA
jgi:hypothetical protein